jgi:hypothetical protein
MGLGWSAITCCLVGADMAYERMTMAEKVENLPKKYREGFETWDLDWRSPIGQRVMADLAIRAQEYGGWDVLSRAERDLVEIVVHVRWDMACYEEARFEGEELPFDRGTYVNLASVLKGYLKDLGLKRRQKPVGSLRERMDGVAA